MPQLIVEVKDKIARGNKERIVCGNSDYTIKFEFDEMWDAYPTKTALYKWGEEFKESERVPFEGDVCRVPKMLNTSGFKVGVYAGDLCSTTPAYFGADQSILCNTTEQDPPAPDIYNEIMELINKKAGGDPTLIRKVFTDVVESGELIYNWTVIPSKYIFRDVVIGGTPDESGKDVIITPKQMPVYGEDLIIEIEGTPYQAKWLSENAIDNGGGDAWVSLNDDGTVTVGGMIGNWVVSLYKASDISPVIIPRDHIPEEQDPTVEDWAKKQEVKYVFRDIHLPSGVYSTVITPEVMPTYGDELIICAEGLFDAKRATWLSETTIDNGGGDLTAYIHEDGTMTISSMMDGVTAYLYYPTEKSVVPADRLPVVDWAIDEDPFVFKDIIIPSGDNQEVTITPNRIPKNGDILMMKVGFNCWDANWESASKIVVDEESGEDAWVQINDDGTITIGSMSGDISLSLYYGSIGQSKANLIFSEQDPTVEDWAKTNLTYYFRAYIPMDENWNVYEVRIPYITYPSLGDSAIVKISADSWYNTYDATFTENGWEFSNPYFNADYWISDHNDGTITIGSLSGDIYMEMYKSVPKDVSVPASKLPVYEWTIKEDPYIVRDLTVYYGNPVTVKPRKMPIYSDDVYADVGGNESYLYWEGDSRLVYGSETTSGFDVWLAIDVDRSSGTLTFTNRSRGSAITLSIYQNPEVITIPRENLPPEVDTTTETWAKKTGFINAKIPNNETSVVINPQYLPSVGSTVDIIWFHPQVGSEVSNAQVVNNNGLPAIYGAGCSVVWTDEYTATVTSELPGSSNTTRVEVVNTSKTPPNRLPIATNDSLGAVKPVSRENNMSQPVGVGIDGRLWTEGYTLPIAAAATLGGVKPVAATDDMTQPVGVDEAGALFTMPGASGGASVSGGASAEEWKTLLDIVTTEETMEISQTFDKVKSIKAFVITPPSGKDNPTYLWVRWRVPGDVDFSQVNIPVHLPNKDHVMKAVVNMDILTSGFARFQFGYGGGGTDINNTLTIPNMFNGGAGAFTETAFEPKHMYTSSDTSEITGFDGFSFKSYASGNPFPVGTIVRIIGR